MRPADRSMGLKCNLMFVLALMPLLAQSSYEAAKPLAPDVILLSRIKYVMRENLARLPNYTCTMTVERSRRPAKSRKFQAQDTVRLEVALVSGKELYAWPGSSRFEDREIIDMVGGGAIGSGDFGLHVRAVLFGPAQYEYVGKEDLYGRPVHQFRYVMPRNLSGFMMRVPPSKGVVGYRGSFWADASTMDLLKLEIDVNDIPPQLPLTSGASVIEYNLARIGEGDFLLPKSSEMVLTDLLGEESRNRTTFANCRHYSGESKLTFEDPPPGADPATQEAPVTLELPGDLDVPLKLMQRLDSKTLAIGDPLEATVTRSVKVKGREWIPKGARVLGRVGSLYRGGSNAPSIVGLRFDRFEFGNKSGEFRANLVSPDIAYFMTLLNRAGQIRRGQAPSPPGGFEPQTGYFYFPFEVFSMPSGFPMTWRTLKSLGDPTK